MSRALEVLDPGPLTTVQDLGRRGLAHLGVTASGALDRDAHLSANAALGNPPDAATLETTLGGCTLRAIEGATVCVTGAPAPVFAGDIPAPFGAPFRLAAGQVLEVGRAASGVRSYVGVRGGVAVEPALGSRSTCLLTGLGPAPLARGDVLPVGSDDGLQPVVFGPAGTGPDFPDGVTLDFRPGPRDDWLAGGAAALDGATYVVADASNRVGLRLTGAALELARRDEIASEGIVTGAIQVPQSGQPIVFLADHPTTGGYPVVGVIVASSLAEAAQAAPGTRVTLRLAR
jgi:biotin-dependent carboxylase-like uncharacterized protein